MTSVNTREDFDFRAYDGTPVTPFYLPVTQLEPITFTLAPPRPGTRVRLGGGKATVGNIVTLIENEAVIFDPIPFTARFSLQSEALDLIAAFGNPLGKSPWTVGGDTWVPVTTANIGTRKNSKGTAIAAPGPKDQVQLDGMYNLEFINAVPNDAPSGVVFGATLKGCVTQTIEHAVEDQEIFITLNGLVFGEIDASITAFTTGNESTLP